MFQAMKNFELQSSGQTKFQDSLTLTFNYFFYFFSFSRKISKMLILYNRT